MNADEIFSLFEGTCPKCGAPVKLVAAGGIAQFKNEQINSEFKGKFTLWKDMIPDDIVDGSMTFKCSNGHESYVEHNIFGDWL